MPHILPSVCETPTDPLYLPSTNCVASGRNRIRQVRDLP